MIGYSKGTYAGKIGLIIEMYELVYIFLALTKYVIKDACTQGC